MIPFLFTLIVQAQTVLGWNPSTSATNYLMYQGYSSGNYILTNSVGTNTIYTNTSVISGRQYFFAVAAQGVGGVSGPSNEVTNTVPIPAISLSLSRLGIVTCHVFAGGNFKLLASSDLKNWTTKLTFAATNDTVCVGTDMDQTNRFLRLAVIPWTYQPPNTNHSTTNLLSPPAIPQAFNLRLFNDLMVKELK